MVYALVTVVVLVVGFVAWRFTSVARGMRQRDERILKELDPLGAKLLQKEPVSAEEVAEVARRPQNRLLLHQMLAFYEKADLLPAEYRTIPAQGEAVLAYWLMHPNELQDPPEEIELVERLKRDRGEFLVYRYRMPSGHWAEEDGWLLGLAGPFGEADEPYSGAAGGFSRVGDRHGEVQPATLVDWYLGILRRKGL